MTDIIIDVTGYGKWTCFSFSGFQLQNCLCQQLQIILAFFNVCVHSVCPAILKRTNGLHKDVKAYIHKWVYAVLMHLISFSWWELKRNAYLQVNAYTHACTCVLMYVYWASVSRTVGERKKNSFRQSLFISSANFGWSAFSYSSVRCYLSSSKW